MDIVNDIIYINRSNILTINFSIEFDGEEYTFLPTDKITFSIYEEGKLNYEPEMSITINGNGEKVLPIELTAEEMTIGKAESFNIVYWYQIELNGQIVKGYDKDGAKQLILNPRGVI